MPCLWPICGLNRGGFFTDLKVVFELSLGRKKTASREGMQLHRFM